MTKYLTHTVWPWCVSLCVCTVVLLSAGQRLAAQPVSASDAVRFLEQTTFGPTPELILQVQQLGFQAFLEEQFNAPMAAYPDLPFWPQNRPASCTDTCQRDNYTMYPLQVHFFHNALYGPDQLRQRVAFALGQILVVSAVDVPLPSWMRSYQQLLYSSAFGNFRQLLYDVTLNPTMGRFLDMLNNRCQTRTPADPNVCRNGISAKPNENYAREFLQLFSIGTLWLNQNGTPQLDAAGKPIETYDQDTIEEFSRVLTGWILAPTLSGPEEIGGTVPNYRDPMRVRVDRAGREDYHDRGEKRVLQNVVLPAGQTTDQDLQAALDAIFNHPNVGPFIGKQLIQKLVTSNPSPAYVARIAAVFADNGAGVRGDLRAVVQAILLDPEARGEVKTEPTYGKLREPVLLMTGLLRPFHATSDGVLNALTINGSPIGAAQMQQDVFRAPSVFNFYPPDYEVPGEAGVLGPEFNILSSITALNRANFVHRVVMTANGIPARPPNRPLGTRLDLTPYTALGGNPDPTGLIEALNALLMHGAMSQDMRNSITAAVEALPASQALLRVRTAVYLIVTSSQYQVER